MNKKIIYFLSWIFLIIWFLNIFLWTILSKNINIELYDISDDITEIWEPLFTTLENQWNRNAQLDISNNGNNEFDYIQEVKKNNYYDSIYGSIIDGWLSVEQCYTLRTTLEIDNCIKDYWNKVLQNLLYVNIWKDMKDKLDITKTICSYWQRTDINIDNCIEKNFIHNANLNYFECIETFKEDDKKYKEKCFERRFQSYLAQWINDNFLRLTLEYNKWLYNIDSKWRIVIKNLSSELLEKEPVYKKMFAVVQPYFTDIEYLDEEIKNIDIDLYNFFKWKIDYYNNLDNFELFPHSKFIQELKNK